MKTKKLLTLLTMLLAGLYSSAQTQFWADDFEDTGSPSAGSRSVSISEFICSSTQFFKRTNGAEISPIVFTGYQNSKYWAAMDIDRGPGCGGQNAISAGQSITWTGINIAGKSGLSFRGLFGANTGAIFQGLPFIPAMDSMAVEYRINGGTWTKIVGIYCNDNTGSGGSMGFDLDGNRIGDGGANTLGNNLSEITATIPGTGNTLDLRFAIFLNNSNPGAFAFDNFRLFESPSCTAPSITGQPAVNTDVCVGNNTTISGSATGATAYKWQYDNGGGFIDVPNAAPYSNVTSTTLTITGATALMNGYDYRLVAINGVSTCFTNSNASNLRVSAINTSANTQTNVACFGGNNGTATVIPSGGIGTYSYSWSPSGGTGATASNLPQGSYTVTVTDNALSGCTATRTFNITQPSAAVSGTTTVTNVACFGGNSGAINLTPTGGTPGYTYNWASGPTTEDRTLLTAGTYSVTITDANGCTGTVSATVTQPASTISGTTTVTNVTCNAGTTGAIDLTPSGGVAPYTYNWGGGITTQDRNNIAAGSYSVTITDVNGCTGTISGITVTQPSAVSGTTVVTNVACFGGNTGAINLTPTGATGPYTYNWASGPTTEDRTNLTAGTYSVTITSSAGCTGTVSATVTQPTAAVSGTTVVTNVACFGGNTGAINLTPTGGTGPYTFNWVSGPTSEDRTGLTAGTYSVTITDVNGCTGTVNATVTQPTAAVSGTTVVTNVACFGASTGAINLTPTGGVGPYTYSWASGPTTEDRTGLTTGTYSVTITDANGCTGTVSGITVTQPASVVSGTTVVTNVSCFGGSNGTINLTPTGGVGPYTFSWASGPTTEDRSGLAAATYSVTITDANGCTGTVNATVTQPAAAVSGTIVVTNIACFGGNTGAINLTPTGGTGPYTFSWGGGITSEDRTNLTAGTYSVTITDANGCTGTVSPTVTQPAAALSGTTVVTNVACFGGNTGAINLTPAGGTGPYTFSWASGPTTEDRTSLTAGTYSVTITDANGCTATVSATVTQPATAVSGTTVVTNVSCNGGNNGAINLTPAGGVGPYTFNWVGGATTEDRTSLTAGSYSVTITDNNGCTGTVSGITVTQPTQLVASAAAQTNIACNGGSNGSATVLASGGTPGYTYSWSPSGGTGVTANGLSAGTYTATVTDANGCTASQSFTITQPTSISFTAAAQTNIACNGGNTGALVVNAATGGTGAFTYDWAPGTPTGEGTTSVTGLTAGTYSVTATDANGCTATVSFTITEPPVLIVTAGAQTNVSCNSGTNGTATVSATGGTPGYTYSWSPSGGTGATANGLAAGTYTVTVTDANGCVATQSFTITQPMPLDASNTMQTNVLCNGESTGSATVMAVGGTGAYTYSWSPSGGTAATATGLAAGTYTVTVTDANNCQSTGSVTITESAAITGSFSQTACNSYTWGSQTHTSSGVYTQTFTSANGCDSIVTLTLSIVTEITHTVTESSCSSFTWAQTGMTYTTSGLYVDTLQTAGGCDSIVTLDLTIHLPSSSSFNEFACGTYTWAQNGMTYTASGAYSDTIPNAFGCDSVITLNLTIGGSSTLLPVIACDSYTWAANGLTYVQTGMYSDTLTDANGCDSIQILDLTIHVSPVATASDNGDATITASPGSSYQWINCATNAPIAGATSMTFTATANGSYAVIVTNASTCSDTSDCVTITNVGLDENSSLFGVELAPNPTQNDVKVTFSGVNEASIVIYDAKGKAVMTLDHIQSGEVLSTQPFERGVYLVHIVTNSGSHTERLVKQ